MVWRAQQSSCDSVTSSAWGLVGEEGRLVKSLQIKVSWGYDWESLNKREHRSGNISFFWLLGSCTRSQQTHWKTRLFPLRPFSFARHASASKSEGLSPLSSKYLARCRAHGTFPIKLLVFPPLWTPFLWKCYHKSWKVGLSQGGLTKYLRSHCALHFLESE